MAQEKSLILVVDDEAGIRKLLGELLEAEGYSVAFAGNGASGLELAAKVMPDLILLDGQMPVLNGFEACQRLRADPVLGEVPIVIVTALSDRSFRLQGIESGADDFIPKPFDATELLARVRGILRLNRYRRLLAERAKFDWVVEHAAEGYVIVNHEGNVVYANSEARLYLGLSNSGPSSESFLDLARIRYNLEPPSEWAHWPADAGPRYFVRPETPESAALWLQVEVLEVPSDKGGDLLIRTRNVTSTMTLRREMWSFHLMMLHKLRTPLTAMLGSMSLLEEVGAELEGHEIVEIAGLAVRGVQRLQGEIEDVLQYLKAPGLAQPGDGVPLAEAPNIVAKIADDLALADVSLHGHDSLGAERSALSRQALELVLRELLENAKKFHPDKQPSVRVELMPASEHSVHVTVSDNGITLPPEMLAQVLVPYFQGDKFNTGQVGGMGLGLAMVAAVLWGVGGKCRIANRTDGVGVMVELTIPLDAV